MPAKREGRPSPNDTRTLDRYPDLLLWVTEEGLVGATRGGRTPAFRAFADATGLPLSRVLPSGIDRELQAALRDHRPTVVEFAEPAGERWFEARVGSDESGLVIVRDISARREADRAAAARAEELRAAQQREAEQALRAVEDRLHDAQRREAMSRLTAGLVHDFGNDLTTILGFTDLLLAAHTGHGDASLRGKLENILGAAQRASALTVQLLALGRKRVPVPRSIDLARAVEAMRPVIAGLLGERSRLAIQRPPKSVWIVADAGDIDHVLTNLALNANDAMPGGGSLSIATFVDAEGRGVLRFRDEGEGMNAATTARVLEPYFTTKAPGKGTGMGLAVVQRIVERAGGTIRIESAPGRGTTFEIAFPCADHVPEATSGRGHEPREDAAPRGEGETVIVVEDEAAVRDLVSEILSSAGYRVIVTDDSEEALERLEAERGVVQLLISDVVMPGMTGRELAEVVRAEHPSVRVVLMSGYAEEPSSSAVVRESAPGYLPKPFTRPAILREVRRVLDA